MNISRRPWGNYQILYDGTDCKVKKITVNQGHRLSLQSHQRRKEDWIVVKGNGLVVLDTRWISVYPGSKVFIGIGKKHRIKNTGQEDLVFIEVQTGTYFGEDDITRYEDDYNRT
tara:strand:+ start:265 stop:606 length:342 start_codon:yes stop_codon:yes gene_type:complete